MIPTNPIPQRIGQGVKVSGTGIAKATDRELRNLRRQLGAVTERLDDVLARVEKLEVRRGRPPKRQDD